MLLNLLDFCWVCLSVVGFLQSVFTVQVEIFGYYFYIFILDH